MSAFEWVLVAMCAALGLLVVAGLIALLLGYEPSDWFHGGGFWM